MADSVYDDLELVDSVATWGHTAGVVCVDSPSSGMHRPPKLSASGMTRRYSMRHTFMAPGRDRTSRLKSQLRVSLTTVAT